MDTIAQVLNRQVRAKLIDPGEATRTTMYQSLPCATPPASASADVSAVEEEEAEGDD